MHHRAGSVIVQVCGWPGVPDGLPVDETEAVNEVTPSLAGVSGASTVTYG